jgi:hypothetical protein
VDEVQQVRHRWPQTLDAQRVEPADGPDDLLRGVAAVAGAQHLRECALVGAVLVNVGDPQLGLPEKGVIGALEDLALFGNRADHRFQ